MVTVFTNQVTALQPESCYNNNFQKQSRDVRLPRTIDNPGVLYLFTT